MIPDLLIWIVCVCGLIIAFIWLPISEYYYVQSAFPEKAMTSVELYAEQDEVRRFLFTWWIIGFLSGLYIEVNEYDVISYFSFLFFFYSSNRMVLYKCKNLPLQINERC